MSVRDVPIHPRGRDQKPTSTSVVLLVSASEQLAERCRKVVFVEGADLNECDLVSLRGTAAWLTPLAIVMTQDVRAFDPEGFSEMSRRIGSELVVLPFEGVSDAQLSAMITAALDISLRRRSAG